MPKSYHFPNTFIRIFLEKKRKNEKKCELLQKSEKNTDRKIKCSLQNFIGKKVIL